MTDHGLAVGPERVPGKPKAEQTVQHPVANYRDAMTHSALAQPAIQAATLQPGHQRPSVPPAPRASVQLFARFEASGLGT